MNPETCAAYRASAGEYTVEGVIEDFARHTGFIQYREFGLRSIQTIALLHCAVIYSRSVTNRLLNIEDVVRKK